MLEFNASSAAAETADTPCAVVGVFEGNLSAAAAAIDAARTRRVQPTGAAARRENMEQKMARGDPAILARVPVKVSRWRPENRGPEPFQCVDTPKARTYHARPRIPGTRRRSTQSPPSFLFSDAGKRSANDQSTRP